jgi:hypothetical protein
VGYELVCEVIDNLAEGPASGVSPFLKVCLEHYSDMLRRNIESNSDVTRLGRQIYQKHKRALDLIPWRGLRRPRTRGSLLGVAQRLGENQPFLGRLRKKGRDHLSLEKVVDMVENARRRILDQKRYDDGVARLYRSVEMWHQWRLLSRYSIETETVKWERVDRLVQDRFLELVQTKELPEDLGLRHARTLDHLLSGKDPEEDDAAFQKLLSARNSSILAHGVDPIGQKSAEKFLQYLDTLVTVPEELRSGARHAELLTL